MRRSSSTKKVMDARSALIMKSGRQNKKRKNRLPIGNFILGDHLTLFDGVGELSRLLYKIQSSVKAISSVLRQHGITKQLRAFSDDHDDISLSYACELIFLNALTSSMATCIVASSTCENEYYVQERLRGNYVVTFVALNGDLTRGVHWNSTVGSIFAIYRKTEGKLMDTQLMQSGNKLLVSGYAVYGMSTYLVIAFAFGIGVHEFILDPDSNEFFKKDAKLTIPKFGPIYSIDESLDCKHEYSTVAYLKRKKDAKKMGKVYRNLYSGSLVADLHVIIKVGGLLISPTYKDAPKGKLLLQFHCNPLAFLVTEAGGLATNGKTEFMNVPIEKPHQLSPLYVGSIDQVSEIMRFTSNLVID